MSRGAEVNLAAVAIIPKKGSIHVPQQGEGYVLLGKVPAVKWVLLLRFPAANNFIFLLRYY